MITLLKRAIFGGSLSDRLDRVAQRYALGYGQYLNALVGIVTNAMMDRNAMEPRVSSDIVLNSFGAAAAFFESHQIQEDGETIMLYAVDAAGGLDEANLAILRDHCWQGWMNAHDALNEATSKDRMDARTLFRRFLFDATLRSAAVGKASALIASRFKYTPVKPMFTRRDRSGRDWTPMTHIRTLIRAALVNTYVDAYLFTLLANGTAKARVVYDDAEHDNHGLVFSIDGADPALPTLEDIRAKVFHPNSTARLEPVTE